MFVNFERSRIRWILRGCLHGFDLSGLLEGSVAARRSNAATCSFVIGSSVSSVSAPSRLQPVACWAPLRQVEETLKGRTLRIGYAKDTLGWKGAKADLVTSNGQARPHRAGS